MRKVSLIIGITLALFGSAGCDVIVEPIEPRCLNSVDVPSTEQLLADPPAREHPTSIFSFQPYALLSESELDGTQLAECVTVALVGD